MNVIGCKSKHGVEEVGISTVNAYHIAIVDLYRTQVSQKVNSHPHPAEAKIIKDLMNSIKKGQGGPYEEKLRWLWPQKIRMKSLTKDELHKITNCHWKQKTRVHNALRDDISEFNIQAMAVRGEHMSKFQSWTKVKQIILERRSLQPLSGTRMFLPVLKAKLPFILLTVSKLVRKNCRILEITRVGFT